MFELPPNLHLLADGAFKVRCLLSDRRFSKDQHPAALSCAKAVREAKTKAQVWHIQAPFLSVSGHQAECGVQHYVSSHMRHAC